MGICNITKDSFSDAGLSYYKNDALKNIKLMFLERKYIFKKKIKPHNSERLLRV